MAMTLREVYVITLANRSYDNISCKIKEQEIDTFSGIESKLEQDLKTLISKKTHNYFGKDKQLFVTTILANLKADNFDTLCMKMSMSYGFQEVMK
ncbi:hypothetical protein HN924_01280 [Candidatus Woesearchaeota archaeon]|nr:hypothetical protein [Candidatus Woesearchaeota archaeon]MBT7062580.1 hypothetical protein [Candidatus Woesearchaeota archaeon]MBT7402373.1 hypothetical protein [Candidatus Woesearchaeota archaeon]